MILQTAKKGKNRLRHRFGTRVERLTQFIHDEFGDVNFEIKELNDDFGPTNSDRNIQALVVSAETEPKGHEINRIRSRKGFDPLIIVTVTMLKAEDGRPLSSSRIRLWRNRQEWESLEEVEWIIVRFEFITEICSIIKMFI